MKPDKTSGHTGKSSNDSRHRADGPGNSRRSRQVAVCSINRALVSAMLLLAAVMPAYAENPDRQLWSSAPGENEAVASGFEELLLETHVNGLSPAVTLIALRDRSGRLWIPVERFRSWSMRPPETSQALQDRDFRLIDGQPGLSYQLNMSRLTLDIEATPQWFLANRVDSGMTGRSTVPEVDPGGFFNYDVNVTHSQSSTLAAGLFEAGAFGNWGVITSTAVARAQSSAGQNSGLVRLDTTWTRDMPARLASLRIGDTIGTGGSWGRPIRFGGVQFASNFETQPGFITFPLPALNGEAALPSTLEIYVNGMRRMQSNVPTGPFSIPDLPAVTGAGEVQLVIRDLLGREQVITDRFYVSSRLLRKGLHEFSYELGAERDAYALASSDYGPVFAAGTHRWGISDTFTGEARVEIRSGEFTAGLGSAWLLGNLGVIHGALAGSHSNLGSGGQFTFGIEHASRKLSLGINLQMATPDFIQLGLRDEERAPRALGQAWVSLPFERAGSVSLSYAHRDRRDEERFRSMTLSYQRSIRRAGYLVLYATRIESEDNDMMLGLTFTRSLGGRTVSSLNGNFSRDGDQLLASVQRSLPRGSGIGYRARAGLIDRRRLDAGFSAQNDYGTWNLSLSRAAGETGVRANASGGLALLNGRLHVSRELASSFAVVDLGGFEGVRIFADNQVVATTDDSGQALLPSLRAYEENPVRIEIGDLPIDAQIPQAESRVVPYYRSGKVVHFAIRRARSAIFQLFLTDGQAVPPGSMITTPAGERFPVGYDGAAFVTGVDSGTELSARWNGEVCHFRLDLPDNADPLPDIGVVSCKEEDR